METSNSQKITLTNHEHYFDYSTLLFRDTNLMKITVLQERHKQHISLKIRVTNLH